MKKVLLIAVMALVGFGMNAQILSSRTVTRQKKESSVTWFVKAGISIDNFTDGGSGQGSTVGGDAVVGFQRPISTSSFYWGMDLGVGSRGFSYKYGDGDKAHCLAWAVRYSPITVGYKLALNDFIAIDPHIGGFLSYDFDQGDDFEGKEFDYGLQAGAGVWLGRFNLDLMYQRGFNSNYGADSSNFIIRLGFAF